MKEVSAKKLLSGKANRKKVKRDYFVFMFTKTIQSLEKVTDKNKDYELVDFLVKHFRIRNWQKFTGIKYYARDVIRLLDDIIELHRSEKQLCRISPPVTIVGDLNGQFLDLIRIFNIKSENCKADDYWKQIFATEKFVFLGDYTEDSPFNLETICLLFSLKMLYTNRYVLLRGHQETYVSPHLQEQLSKRFPGVSDEISQKFLLAFSLLPNAAVVGEKILCVHSGISPSIGESIDEINKIPKTDIIADMGHDLLFSCPIERNTGLGQGIFFTNMPHQPIKMFNEVAVKEFCVKTGIQLIIRSHEIPMNGFHFFADRKLITISSSPAFKNCNNKGAFLRVEKDGAISIIQLKPSQQKLKDKDLCSTVGETAGKNSRKTTNKNNQKVENKNSEESAKKSIQKADKSSPHAEKKHSEKSAKKGSERTVKKDGKELKECKDIPKKECKETVKESKDLKKTGKSVIEKEEEKGEKKKAGSRPSKESGSTCDNEKET